MSYSPLDPPTSILNIFPAVNVSVCVFPIEMLSRIFHYGYAAPFYNLSRAFRTITFDTRNQRKELPLHRVLYSHVVLTVGLNFGVLIAWILISCITLPLVQWIVWKRAIRA